MPRLDPTALLAAAALALGAAGCRHTVPARAPGGSSAYAFVDTPAPPAPRATAAGVAAEPQPSDVLLMANPVEPLAPPAYPAAASGSHALPVLVSVRLVVDASGRVIDVRPSPVALSTPTPHLASFMAEVEAALRQWRFRPAVLRHLEPVKGEDGGYGWRVTRADPTECILDVAFTFTPAGGVLAAVEK